MYAMYVCISVQEKDDLQSKKAEMLAYEEDAKTHYGNFLLEATELLKEKNADLENMKLLWSGYNDGKISRKAHKAKSIVTFMTAICGTQGPYRYENLLSLLINLHVCGQEGKALVANYEQVLKCKHC